MDMGNQLIYNVQYPNAIDHAANKAYVDRKITALTNSAATKQQLNAYLKKDGSVAMTGDLNTSGHKITNLRSPASNSEPATKNYTDINFLKLNGTKKMTGNLDMNNNKIIGLATPTSNTDAATKKYVDDNTVSNLSFIS